MVLNLLAEPRALVFDAGDRGIKPLPSRWSKLSRRSIKDEFMTLSLDRA
jgi:hypothetical protein